MIDGRTNRKLGNQRFTLCITLFPLVDTCVHNTSRTLRTSLFGHPGPAPSWIGKTRTSQAGLRTHQVVPRGCPRHHQQIDSPTASGDEVTRAGNRHGIPVSGWQPSTTRLARRSTGSAERRPTQCVTSPPHVAWLLPEAVQRADSHGVLVVRSHQGRDEVVGVLVLVELAHRRVDL